MSYFNSLPFREALKQLGKCRFMDRSEFNGVGAARQEGRHRGLRRAGPQPGPQHARFGLDVSYALRADAIEQKRVSYTNATRTASRSAPTSSSSRAPTSSATWLPTSSTPTW